MRNLVLNERSIKMLHLLHISQYIIIIIQKVDHFKLI